MDTSYMEVRNCTPHNVMDQGTGISYFPSGEVARVDSVTEDVTATFKKVAFGKVTDLPEKRAGVLLLVSGMVRSAVPERGDVISPGPLVRDEDGKPIGCGGFYVNDGFERFVRISRPCTCGSGRPMPAAGDGSCQSWSYYCG